MHAIKCPKCAAKYEFEDTDIGTSATCDCGEILQFVVRVKAKAEPPKPSPAMPEVKAEVKINRCTRCRKELDDPLQFLCLACQTVIEERERQQKRIGKSGNAAQREEMAEARRRPAEPHLSHGDVPAYGSMVMVATLMRVVGVLGILVGGAALLFGLMQLTDKEATAPMLIATGGGALLTGIVQLGISESILALRDIARNSFRR